MRVVGVGGDDDRLLHVGFEHCPGGLLCNGIAVGIVGSGRQSDRLALGDGERRLVGGQREAVGIDHSHVGLAGGQVDSPGTAVAHAHTEVGGRRGLCPRQHAALTHQLAVSIEDQGIAALTGLVG